MEGVCPSTSNAAAWSAMQEMTSATAQNSQHPESAAQKYRKTLNDLILTMFELRKSNKDLIRLFNCISHCVEEFPQIFVVPSHVVDSDDCLLSKRAVSLAFTKWLIARVFQLLSSQNVPEYHNHCTTVLISLWKLLEIHDLSAYQSFVADLVKFCANITEVHSQFRSIKDAQPIDISRIFNGDKDMPTNNQLNLVECPIMLSGCEACENLQIEVLRVIIGVLNGIIQFVGHMILPVWILLCRQIEEGSLPIKKLSFDAINLLITNDGLPKNVQILNYLTDCTVACLKLIRSSNGASDESYLRDLSFSISSVLYQLIIHMKDAYRQHDTVQSLIMIAPHIKCPPLQDSIGKSIHHYISRNVELAKPWEEMLLNFVGQLDNSEWLINSLLAIIIKKMEQQLNHKEKMQNNLSQETSTVEELLIWKGLLDSLDTVKDIDMLHWLKSTCDIMLLSILLRKGGYNLRFSKVVLKGWEFRSSLFSEEISLSHERMKEFYYQIIRYTGLLLNSRGVSAWESCLHERIDINVMLLSLPWLFETTSIYDLPNKCWHMNSTLKTITQTSLGDSEKVLALPLLAALPFNVAPHWRIFVFCHELNSKEPAVQKSAIQCLPVLLNVLGKEHFRRFEMAIRNLYEAPVSVVKELASACGPLSCVLINSSKINWCGDILRDGYFEVDLNCADIVVMENGDLDDLNELYKFLIYHPDSIVRLELTSKLEHVLKHTKGTGNLLNLCLSLLEDKNYDVRYTFSKCMPAYLNALQMSKKSFETLLSQIKTTYLSAKGKGNWRLQETVLLSIGNLGKDADEDLLLVIIIILLENLLLPGKAIISATASLQLKNIAAAKQIKPNRLFTQLRRPISQVIFDTLHDAQERGNADPLELLKSIVKVFDFTDLKSILTMILPYLLPHLVVKASVHSTALIRSLAKELQMNKRELLANNFKYIFCHLVCYCSGAAMEKSLSYIKRETEVEIGILLRCDCQKTYNELLLHIGSHYDQVFSGLVILASEDENDRTTKAIENTTEMAEVLQPRFLGFLAFFDSRILNSNISLEDKRLAVGSLASVIKLMGPKHITPVRMKVMTTLRIIIRSEDPQYLNVCCQAWDAFIHNLTTTVIGSMLNQIVVSILPLLGSCLEGVLTILTYLIVENQECLQSFFSDLYFIPDIPELSDINAVLRKHQERASSQDQNDVQALLCNSLRGVHHENVDVRVHALTNLQHIIAAHQTTLHLLIIGSDSVDPLITQLVGTLLAHCSDTDPRVRSFLGICLGELGAIDPGRLDMKNSNHKEDHIKIYDDIDDDCFVVDLVCGLSRGFLGAVDTRTQDCSSYAIQEVLQVYQCIDTKDISSPGGRLWNSFPEHVQEIIAPLLHSRYMPTKINVENNMPQPIYCSSKGLTFHDWIKNWTEYLMEKVKHSKAKQIFCACRMIIRHDVSIALFLLPHILVYALIAEQAEDVDSVSKEILAVLTHSNNAISLQPDLHHMSVQAVFSVLDYLRKWLGNRTANLSAFSRAAGSTAMAQDSQTVNRVQSFLDGIPKDVLATASFRTQGYTRSLMNLEAFLKGSPHSLQEQLGFLQKLYRALDEPDAVIGVNSVRQETSLMDEILSHESSGQPQDALRFYERAIQMSPNEASLHQGLVRCLMDLDQPHTALAYTNGLLAQRSDWVTQLNHYRVEAAWKLANWDSLDSYLKCTETETAPWGVGIGNILAAMKSKNNELAMKHLEILRSEQMTPLSAASMENGSYQRGYDHIMRLHMLDELKNGMDTLFGQNINEESIRKLLSEWKTRKQFVQSSMRCVGPMLNLRRVILEMAIEDMEKGSFLSKELKNEIGRCWLYSAKIARKYGHLQRASSSLLTASNYLENVCLEQAKWHWQKGEQEQAILCLKKVVKDSGSKPLISEMSHHDDSPTNSKLAWAKTKLLLAQYMEESSNLDSDSIINLYVEVVEINQEWEDGHFFLAQFLDRLLTPEWTEKRSEMIIRIVKHFGTSLVYGCRYIYQSMPKMLSLWLDFGTVVAELEKNAKNARARMIQESLQRNLNYLHNKLIYPFVQKLPPYLFLTAFSQLISRICHSQADVFRTLKEIIAKLLVTYPQQSVWMMMAVSKSTYQIRVKRCEEIFNFAQSISPDLNKFLSDATKLTDRFLELSNRKFDPTVTTVSINANFRALVRLLENKDFSHVLLPRQASLMVTLPTGPGSHLKHDPFLHNQVYICGIRDAMELMPSLQRPKKISLKATDGKYYDMMCKPKDDLRKDCRLMEFNSVVNKFLLKDAESRRRQLHIRTYAVVPLNEECGLLEWVPNLAGLRHILNGIYKERKMYTDGKQLKNMAPSRNASLEQKMNVFKNQLLPRYPPVFSDWFLRTFSDPTTWYLARLSYARTTAVMSMIGYILGLGDRHGENILFDSSCGDTVHVDFNCLFNKGETFEWPELVPFRLTHNMIEAMGPLGYEGIYRKSCEVTLRVMRKQLDTLMSLLKPFIHDPLLEWSCTTKAGGLRGNMTDQGEINNEKAMIHVQDIELRLKGVIKNKATKTKSTGMPLSIEGQVNYVIQEATDIKNLSQMYIGWAAYL